MIIQICTHACIYIQVLSYIMWYKSRWIDSFNIQFSEVWVFVFLWFTSCGFYGNHSFDPPTQSNQMPSKGNAGNDQPPDLVWLSTETLSKYRKWQFMTVISGNLKSTFQSCPLHYITYSINSPLVYPPVFFIPM